MSVMCRSARSRAPEARRGFTLVELLIVISIIAILSSLVIAGLSIATKQKNKTEAQTTISAIVQGLENYRGDEGTYPAFGLEPDPERNDFPELWRALMHDPPLGGRNAPYLEGVPKDKVRVLEDEDEGIYRPATEDELDDPKTDIYVVDPWEKPYVYRCNQGQKERDWMINEKKFDVYSLGPNMVDDTIVETDEDMNDDLTN